MRSRDRAPNPTSRVVSVLLALVLLSTTAVLAGGVRVVEMRLSDNGDDDGFADRRETVSLLLVVQNTTGADLTGVVARLAVEDPATVCVTDPTVVIGGLAAGEVLEMSTGFTFVVGDVNRSGISETLTADFALSIEADQGEDLAVPERFTLDLDLDVVDSGSGPETFFESFENDYGMGQFTPINMDEGKHDDVAVGPSNLSYGFRCQDCGYHCRGAWCPSEDCSLGSSDAQAAVLFWHVEGPDVGDGGRAFTGTRSLHMAAHLGAPQGFTTPFGHLEAVAMKDPVPLGWGHVCETTRSISCVGDPECPEGEACVEVRPTLSIKHQIRFLDNSLGSTWDRGVVQVQLADTTGYPLGHWMTIEPNLNVYDRIPVGGRYQCSFDPIDDGNTEADFFGPLGSGDYGPSSTCRPRKAFAYLGDTDDPFDPANVGNASDGPGLEGETGVGTWVESRFDLSRFRGRSIRIRFLSTTIRAGDFATPEDFPNFLRNPRPDDDGWWIDDVTVSDTLAVPATVAVDFKNNGSLPGLADGDGDGVSDPCDNCPEDDNPEQDDQDGDGAGEICDPCPYELIDDEDGDGICWPPDNCRSVYNLDQADGDQDGSGDLCDLCPEIEDDQYDEDGDGVPSACDPCPLEAPDDADGDGLCCEGNLLLTSYDDCCDIPNPGSQLFDNSDGDWIGDPCDNCPLVTNAYQEDEVHPNGIGDHCDDPDGDDVFDRTDNCPDHPNNDQSDLDDDGVGDACDGCPLLPDAALPGGLCCQSDSDGDGLGDACDNCPNDDNLDQADQDYDGIGDACDTCLDGFGLDPDGDGVCTVDCDETDNTIFPDAPEINDALDNQCPGDIGHGSIDEISPDTGFRNAADRNEYSWTAQQGATLYRVVRSDTVDFATGCMIFERTGTTLVDTEDPLPGEAFHYLVHPLAPNEGSYGQTSAGSERVVPCAP